MGIDQAPHTRSSARVGKTLCRWPALWRRGRSLPCHGFECDTGRAGGLQPH